MNIQNDNTVISLASKIAGDAAAAANKPNPMLLDERLAYEVVSKGLGYLEDRDPMPGELAAQRAATTGAKTFTLTPLERNIGSLLYRTDTGKPLSIVGDQFKIVQNKELHESFIGGLENGLPGMAWDGEIKSKQETSFDGRYAQVDFQFSGMMQEIKQLTKKPTILNFRSGWSQGHGGRAIRCWGAAVDLVCDNGMMGEISQTDAFRHTASFTPDRLGEFIAGEAENFWTRCQTWQKWAMQEITPAQAQEVLEQSGQGGRTTAHLMEQVAKEADARGYTVWAVYSALTFMQSHDSEAFPVRRNTHGHDNVAATLAGRNDKVRQIVSSPAFQALAA